MAHTFVLTSEGEFYVQVRKDSGEFFLTDGDQSWPGGNGIAREWEALSFTDRRIPSAVHAQMDWVFD